MSVHSLPGSQADGPLTERVAAEVRALMGRYGVTQMHLVEVLHVSQTGVSKRLRGIIPFDANEIGILARFFDVDPAQLLGAPGRGGGPPRGGSSLTEQYADHARLFVPLRPDLALTA